MLQMPSSTNKNDDAMSLLGTFLLQGWVMTDQLCSETSCSVPLMRSKDGMIQFCVIHDPHPTSNVRNTMNTSTNDTNSTTNQVTTTTATVSDDTEDDESIIVIEHAPQQRLALEDDEFKIKQERREQSSRASQLIGQKMLQRWALLNDICPNSTCYAIPLVRHPSNKSLYCVICEQSYQPENSSSQQTTTTTTTTSEQQPTPSTTHTSTVSMTHTPIGSPALDRSTKRQKKEKETTEHTIPAIQEEATTSTTSISTMTTNATDDARAATEITVRRLTNKLTLLTDRMEQCADPNELVGLCQSLEACAKALGACAATLNTLLA